MTTPGTPAVDDAPVTATDPPRTGLRAILQPGWLSVIALAVIFAALCFWVLAPWQFGRHAEREAQNSQITAAGTESPQPVLDFLFPDREPDAASTWRPVTATGTFREADQVQIRLRQSDTSAANEVVVPFELVTGQVLLVDRGYITESQLKNGEVPPPLPTGVVTITGRVQPDQPDPAGRPAQLNNGRVEYYGIDPAQIVAGESQVLQGFIQLTETSPGVMQPIGLPQIEGGPFLSYALQWITFGVIALLAIIFFAFREFTGKAAETPDSESSPEPPPTTKFKKSDLYD